MDTLYTQNLEYIHYELTCSRSDQAKVVFWADAKIEDFNFKNKKSDVDKSYSFQLYIFQLIQKILNSNFLNLISNIQICLNKNDKILFLLEKKNIFRSKFQPFFPSQMHKSRTNFGIFVPSCPKSAKNKVF
jgi:hypothetical protein